MEMKDNDMVTPTEDRGSTMNDTDGQTMGLTTALNKILKEEEINGSNQTSNLKIADFVASK